MREWVGMRGEEGEGVKASCCVLSRMSRPLINVNDWNKKGNSGAQLIFSIP